MNVESGSGHFRNFEFLSLTREFLEQYDTEKQNGYLRTVRLIQEVLVYE